MQEFLNIKYLRDNQNDDIISLVKSETKTTITLTKPLSFFIEWDHESDGMELYTKKYIPEFMLNEPEITLSKKQFKFILDRSMLQDHFIDFYVNSIGMNGESDEPEFQESNVVSIKDAKPKLH